jgi:hypothetical protein
VTNRSLNGIGNNDHDLISSDENESMLRKKGLKSHKIIREFNNTIEVKYCSFTLKNRGRSINAKIISR